MQNLCTINVLAEYDMYVQTCIYAELSQIIIA